MNLGDIITLRIIGKNINNFINRLYKNNIEILNIEYINNNEIIIKIKYNDYEIINKLKTIYKIEIINLTGFNKFKKNIKENEYLLIFIILFIIIIYILSNIIFSIKIYSNDSNIQNIILEELNNNNIKKYRFKKNYNEIQKVKKEILNKYKDNIEWLEIKYNGTKIIVKVEKRVINNIESNNTPRNIVAKKDSIITSLDIEKGEIIKGVNSYVKKGEVIVSGELKLNDEVITNISSTGKVYGEVWYKTSVSYPINYKEEKYTKNKMNVLSVTFLNKKIELFNFKKYEYKSIKVNKKIKNNLLPISINIEKQNELNIINKKYTKEELLNKSIEYSNKKIKDKLKENEYIKEYKVINYTLNETNINVEIFYSVIEEIGEYQVIVNQEDKKQD